MFHNYTSYHIYNNFVNNEFGGWIHTDIDWLKIYDDGNNYMSSPNEGAVWFRGDSNAFWFPQSYGNYTREPGELDYSTVSGLIARATIQGLPVKGVMGWFDRPLHILVARPGFKRLTDFKGRKIGVSGLGRCERPVSEDASGRHCVLAVGRRIDQLHTLAPHFVGHGAKQLPTACARSLSGENDDRRKTMPKHAGSRVERTGAADDDAEVVFSQPTAHARATEFCRARPQIDCVQVSGSRAAHHGVRGGAQFEQVLMIPCAAE